MKELEHEEMSALLQKTFPHVDAELQRDLWPAMLRRMEAAPAAPPWYDWALAACSAGALLFFPKLLLLIAYHL